MHALILSLLLSAEPAVDVVVLETPDVEVVRSALAKALPGHTLRDASEVHRTLFPGSLLGFADLQGFTAPPPAGWPSALTGLWKESLTFCRQVAGPLPWKDPTRFLGARCCGIRLGRMLWERALAELKAVDVFEVRQVPNDGDVETLAIRYQPGSRERRVANVMGGNGNEPVLAVVKQVIEGGGRFTARPPGLPLFTPVLAEPWSPSEKSEGPVAKVIDCAALPKTLVVEGAPRLSKTLAERWTATVHGEEPPLKCSVTFSSHHEPEGAVELEVVTTVLACGDQTYAAEVASVALKPLEMVSSQLISQLARLRCGATKP